MIKNMNELNKNFDRYGFKDAHVHNPDPMDCRPENLAALCQKCHNTHDAPMRAKKAAETRARKRKQKQKEQGQMMIEEMAGVE